MASSSLHCKYLKAIKSNLTCNTKNLIYMIQCNRCNLQYIGETKRRLKDRFNEHRRTIDNPNTKSKPTTAAEHFLSSPNHTANGMQLTPIEKIFSNRDSSFVFLVSFYCFLFILRYHCYFSIIVIFLGGALRISFVT